jgi:ribosomal protein S27AE
MAFWQPGPNLWFGVRLPWTLADPYIWNKSWRLASRLLMVMGVTVLISWRAFWISTAHLVGLSCLYTVILYRWKYGTWRFWKDQGGIAYRPVARCPNCGHFQKLASHADLARSACETCGAKRPERRIGLRALRPPGAEKDQQFVK